MQKIVLIDVSNLFFRAFYAVPPNFTMADGTPSNAVYGTASVVFSLLESEKPTHFFAAQDLREPTFRHKEIEGYKDGRPPMPAELSIQLPFVFEFFSEGLNIPLLSKESFEADDIIASVAEYFREKENTEVLILSADQDLFQLVGENVYLMVPQNGGKPPIRYTPEMVEEKMGIPPNLVPDYKSMAGDNSDNLAGVPGIGPKGACKILAEFGCLEKALENTDKISGKNGRLLEEHREQAILTKKMATLHRDLEMDGFSVEAGDLGENIPENLLPFLEKISTRRLMARAEKIWGIQKEEKKPPQKVSEEQLGMF